MTERFVASVVVPGRLDVIRPTASFLVGIARSLQAPPARSTLFENAVVEALNNAIEHNTRQHHEALHCEIELTDRRLAVRVLDEAAQAPLALALPTGSMASPAEERWPDIPESGYGLYLIQAVFPEVRPVARDGRHGIEMAVTF